MKTNDGTDPEKILQSVFMHERFAILTTSSRESQLHSNVVCFISSDDLKSIVFVTPKETRKYANIMAGGNAAFFIDTRCGSSAEISQIYGVEARGRVHIQKSPGEYREAYISRFPELKEFADAPSAAWCRMEVDTYDIVHTFQTVVQYCPDGSR